MPGSSMPWSGRSKKKSGEEGAYDEDNKQGASYYSNAMVFQRD